MKRDPPTPSDKATTSQGRESRSESRTTHMRFWIGVIIALGIGTLAWWNKDNLTLDNFAGYEGQLKAWRDDSPQLVFAIGFVVYVIITGLSLPGAAALTILSGWVFGVAEGTLLASFASTSGASIAFLLSRYFFRDSLTERLGSRWKRFQDALDQDGAFYLFTLRLVPAVPFFAINAGMGLTKIRWTTFWWVSQIGMLPGTLLYVYAGSQIPSLKSLAEDGVQAVFSGSQLLQLAIAFALLGLFPIAARKTTQLLWKLKR